MFDAIGHWAVGHPPDSNTIVLALGVGTFVLTGQSVVFEIKANVAVGTFSLLGKSMILEIDEVLGSGAFLLTGFGLTTSLKMVLGKGGFVWTGYDLTFNFDRAFTFKRFITECHAGKVYTTRVEDIKHT